MKYKSIWMENVKNKTLSSLDSDTECDVLIVGGGMAGLMTAYFLKDSNNKVILIDRDKCAEGASAKNTGKLTFMQELVYQEIEKNYNSDRAKSYLESQKEAIALATEIIEKNKIECNLEKIASYVFINDNKDLNKLEKEMSFYKKNDIECEIKTYLPIPFDVKYALKTGDTYTFNPYKFLVAIKNILKDKIKIYENTKCIEVKKEDDYHVAVTETGKKIRTKSLVIATQYPFFIVPYFIPFKTKVQKSFIVATSLEPRGFSAISNKEPTMSINYYYNNEGYLIYSRNSHNIGSHLDVRCDYEEITSECEKFFGKKAQFYFQNHDLITYDKIPYIGAIDKNMYVLTGFNKWGNTNGIIGGKVISDLILNKDNLYTKLFDPKRSLSWLKIKNLFLYNTLNVSSLIWNKLKSNKKFYNDKVIIKYIDGKKCGIYYDDKGNKHIVSNICPHMKCNLIFNYVDKTWDCPCHASRFDIDGNIIYGPAVYDIKIDKK